MGGRSVVEQDKGTGVYEKEGRGRGRRWTGREGTA